MICFLRWIGVRCRTSSLLIVLIFATIPSFGAYYTYNVDTINDSLKVNADAIIRDYSTVLEIENVSSAKRTVHYVVTILNKSGEHFGIFNETYHKFLKVENFSGNVYDASGRLIKELKKSDFKDLSAISGYTLFDDTRRKYLSPVTNFFPYTIEYNYEVRYDGLFYYPTWYPISSYNLACEKSSMEVRIPERMNFRYKASNLKDSVEISKIDGARIYSWNIKNEQAFVNEGLSPELAQIVPKVRLAPNNFEIDGYYGNQQTWQNFGIWVKSLNEGKGNLENLTINEIKSEIGELNDTLSLIKNVYQYVQSRTRYVNLKLGIGGYQPIDAQTVHNVGYGDCKALTNYTKSILDIYGIKSYYTLVQAGEEASDIEIDFPSAQFNHAFLSVPYRKDTIWLECTSQTNPFGYIGSFTDDRDVLLITDNGGKIVKTPTYNDLNLIKRFGEINVDEKGNAVAVLSFLYQGAEYSEVSEIFELSDAEQKKWIYKKLPFSSFKINNLSLDQNINDTIQAILTLNIELEKYASVSNKRIFIPLINFDDEHIPMQNLSNNRHNDIYIRDTRNIVDSLIFTYPSGFDIEYLPESNNENTNFGDISIEIKEINKNKILVFSSIELKEGSYNKEEFNKLIDYTDVVKKTNNSKAVLIRKEKTE